MNTLFFVLFGLAWFIFAYYWYGGIIKRKVVHADKDNEVPSRTMTDGKDYVPTKAAILFGHHFSSIAGAGPIIGPILAFAWFGWLPAMIWILLGSVFMGAVHDYTALMVSVRNKGHSIVEISEKVLSPRARTIFAVFVWITLMLVQAVFAHLVAQTLVEEPGIAFPTIGIIALALVFGWAVLKKGSNFVLGTIISIAILCVLIIYGKNIRIEASYDFWLITMVVYAFIAAVIPVQILLQPRDYLSVYILLIGMAIGFAGLIVMQPEIAAPAYVDPSITDAPPIFPILFITVACGAISGFHSLVSSGTSAKQLGSEIDGRKVAFGGMLSEGALALLVILLISSVLVWSPDKSATGEFVFQNILGQSANLVFSNALGRVGEALGIPFIVGLVFGGLMLNAFILTTLDTSARLNRYIVQETLASEKLSFLKNRYAATAASLIVAYFFAKTGNYEVLWPMFGSSNQLIAALALFVISTYLFGFKIPKWYTLIPASLMLIVTESALVYQIFFEHIPNEAWHLVVIAAILFILGIMIAYESYAKIVNMSKTSVKPAETKA